MLALSHEHPARQVEPEQHAYQMAFVAPTPDPDPTEPPAAVPEQSEASTTPQQPTASAAPLQLPPPEPAPLQTMPTPSETPAAPPPEPEDSARPPVATQTLVEPPLDPEGAIEVPAPPSPAKTIEPTPPRLTQARPPQPRPLNPSARQVHLPTRSQPKIPSTPDTPALAARPEPVQPPSATPSAAPPPQAVSIRSSAAWLSGVGAWLLAHRSYPEAARQRGQQGTVVVHFTVERDGHVVEVTIVRGSGSDMLDQAAMALLQNARLPPFPIDMTMPQQSMTVPLHYRLE